MKKIVPFNNVLTFDTDVSEITAISLEHDITKESDAISGVFHITGEYKITDGVIETDKFSFDLPFDVALGNEYDLSTLEVDIDDFRYELIGKDKLKVNIDLYLDGEEVEPEPVHIEEELFTEKELRKLSEKEPETPSREVETQAVASPQEKGSQKEETTDLFEEMNTNANNDNINIFNGFNEEEKYVTYHVYPVLENDTLDKILEKYHLSKEELAKYNSLEDIKPGDKLIIPADDK